MAHKKGAGSTRNGRDSAGQRLGGKEYAGSQVEAGADHRPPRGPQGAPGLEGRGRQGPTPLPPGGGGGGVRPPRGGPPPPGTPARRGGGGRGGGGPPDSMGARPSSKAS